MRFAAAVLLLLCTWCVFAIEPDAFDKQITDELRALDPTAAGLFIRANAAREVGKHAEAAALYKQVHERVPTYVHALRRLGHEELELGLRDQAVTHFREALALSRSSENLAAMAIGLVENGKDEPVPGEADEAKQLANEAVSLDPKDPYKLTVLARVAERTQDLPLLRAVAFKMAILAPNDPSTHLMQMSVAASDGNWDDARKELELARAAGLPQEHYNQISGSLQSAQPFYLRWWKPALVILAAWFGAFGLLFLLGVILSKAAVHAAEEPLTDLSANASGLSGGVRRVYAAVLGLSSVFYYLSLPIVMLLVLGSAGGLVYGFFVLGHIPIKLVVLIVIVGAISVWSMLKSLFVRPSDDDPGTRVELEREPRLRQVLDEVAAKIGTHAVDNVYLTPGTEVAVMERRRKKERCLILGIAALDGLAMRPFKAVLGHEYGHFTNRDTAGGAFALSVRNSISATAIGIAQGGAAAWYNPAWLFVNAFHRVFLRISEGASRLQEVLADRWAVFAYGAQAFEDGLRHIVERGVRFDAHVGATLKEVVDSKVPLANLYTYTPANPTTDVSEAVEEALNRKSSAYDSHPAPADRFKLVHALPQPPIADQPDDAMPAWSLFTDPLAIQHLMTEQVRVNVRANYGVEIVAPEPA